MAPTVLVAPAVVVGLATTTNALCGLPTREVCQMTVIAQFLELKPSTFVGMAGRSWQNISFEI